jgi:hypothetical protein
MAQPDQAIAEQRTEVRAVENSLDPTLFLLVEDVNARHHHRRAARPARPPCVLDVGGRSATLRRFPVPGD